MSRTPDRTAPATMGAMTQPATADTPTAPADPRIARLIQLVQTAVARYTELANDVLPPSVATAHTERVMDDARKAMRDIADMPAPSADPPSIQDPAVPRHGYDRDLWGRVGDAIAQWTVACEQHTDNRNMVGPNSADYVMAVVQPALNQAKSAAVDAACERITDYAERPGIDDEQRRVLRAAVRIARGEDL